MVALTKLPRNLSNTYFRFKQFTIHQDQCSMKVCTDACLFGAYLARWLKTDGIVQKQALDIGTGTGLLSLMLAQKTPLEIESIEIDRAAAQQASENFAASPWKDRLTLVEGDVTKYFSGHTYDLIFSNPPFFEADLRSPDKRKNAAKHHTELTLDQLVFVADRSLTPEGFFAVLLPYQRVASFIQRAGAHDLHLRNMVLVKHTASHPFFRGILLFGRNKQVALETEIILKEGETYSSQFIELLKDYYLHL